jgi:hypothetical protein
MNPVLKRMLAANSIIWAAFYVIRAFVIWEIYNPFWWVLDIPTYSNESRGFIAFFGALYWIFLWVFFSDTGPIYYKEKEAKK